LVARVEGTDNHLDHQIHQDLVVAEDIWHNQVEQQLDHHSQEQ
jgi:hypothetical protein